MEIMISNDNENVIVVSPVQCSNAQVQGGINSLDVCR